MGDEIGAGGPGQLEGSGRGRGQVGEAVEGERLFGAVLAGEEADQSVEAPLLPGEEVGIGFPY